MKTRSQTRPAAKTPSPRNRSGGIGAHRAERRAGLVLAAPFGIFFVTFFIVPLAYSFYASLYRDRLIGGLTFTGMANYLRAAVDPLFWKGVLNVVIFGSMRLPLIMGFAILAALLIDAGTSKLAKVFRIGIFLPYAVPSVIAALIWGYIYGPTFGPIAQIAEGLGHDAPNFFSPDIVLGSLANIAVWQFVGYNTIILYAALRSVSPELYEAAALDGAGALKTAWHIKLPALRPTLALVVVFSLIATFQYFTEPRIFAAMAPGTITPSFTPNLYAYNLAFTNQQYSYSAAISFALGVLVVIASSAWMVHNNRKGMR
ncbi:MAG: sugar ABC transporter permease [Bifidobacteriaceae bacterium]|jgi:multiple sugar transport system permease protein|nr:sugar ABC transporter permease [Bifidobacteriaceae bacterium]